MSSPLTGRIFIVSKKTINAVAHEAHLQLLRLPSIGEAIERADAAATDLNVALGGRLNGRYWFT